MVILVTAYGSLETAVRALRAGAFDYLLKPVIHEEMIRVVRQALDGKVLCLENRILKRQIKERYDFTRIVGRSREVLSLIQEIKKIANAKSSTLILGETGTGKELFIRAIHYNSQRSDKPFMPINCIAIPHTLLESELFGYVKGAFTGATHTKRGLFEEADGGTLFLDEIGDLSPDLQAKLLRVMDDREIRPLGSTASRKVDIRILAATNKDLVRAVRKGAFRDDLYYRISVVTLKVPPLRERKEDIGLLSHHFLGKYSQEIGRPVKAIDDKAMNLLLGYQWPGNVRELQNIIERAVLLAEGDTLLPEHLPEGLRSPDFFLGESINKTLSIENYVREFILRFQSSFREQELAGMLGITRKSLWEKRKRWGLRRG